MAASSLTSDTRTQTTFDFAVASGIKWVCHYSYAVVEGRESVVFFCRTCLREIDHFTTGQHHCWECLSKYCEECWKIHEYGANWQGSTCPQDRPGGTFQT